jgi:hypothetical protein
MRSATDRRSTLLEAVAWTGRLIEKMIANPAGSMHPKTGTATREAMSGAICGQTSNEVEAPGQRRCARR